MPDQPIVTANIGDTFWTITWPREPGNGAISENTWGLSRDGGTTWLWHPQDVNTGYLAAVGTISTTPDRLTTTVLTAPADAADLDNPEAWGVVPLAAGDQVQVAYILFYSPFEYIGAGPYTVPAPEVPPAGEDLTAVNAEIVRLLAAGFQDWQVFANQPHMLSGDSIWVTLSSVGYHLTMGSTSARLDYSVTAAARVSNPENTWKRIAALMTPTTGGVRDVLESGLKGNEAVESVKVSGSRLGAPTMTGDQAQATVEFDLEVTI